MKLRSPYKLLSLCKDVSAKAIFDSLIDTKDEEKINQLLRDFLVNASFPKRLLLEILGLLLVYLDRGYIRHQWPKPPCEDASRDDVEARNEENLEPGEVNDLGRRQRANWITRSCVHHVISRWGEESLYPIDLLNEEGFAPRAMSMRGRQTVVMYMVESFIEWTQQHLSSKMCDFCELSSDSFPAPPRVLNLRAEHGNWSGTRIALAAISSTLKSKFRADNGSPEPKCSKCGSAVPVDRKEKLAYHVSIPPPKRSKNIFDCEKPVIKLDVVLIGSIQDWVVEVLLYVLRHSPSFGFSIEISAIRSENMEVTKFCEVIDSLEMPEKVTSLEYRTKEPEAILSAANVLKKLTGLQTFTFAHLWSKSKYRTRFTTAECYELGKQILAEWKMLKKIRLEGICLFCDYLSDQRMIGGGFLPDTVRYVEFAYGSLSPETLDWLCDLPNELDRIQTIRFDNERVLGASSEANRSLLCLLRKKRRWLRTFSVDHCGLSAPQAGAMQAVLTGGSPYRQSETGANQANVPPSALEHFTFREPSLSSEVTLDLFECLCVAAEYRLMPHLTYFATLLPPESDRFWEEAPPVKKGAGASCPFDSKLREIALVHHCSQVCFEIFWEPSEEEL